MVEIIFSKENIRNRLKCIRNDGSFVSTDISSRMIDHDLAHFVVEKEFGMKNGFYGNINSGFNFEELSDKEIIKELDPEAWLSEIMARNLQSLGVGTINCKEYKDLVNWESQNYPDINVPKMSLFDVEKIKDEFINLSNKWFDLAENGILRLYFE